MGTSSLKNFSNVRIHLRSFFIYKKLTKTVSAIKPATEQTADSQF